MRLIDADALIEILAVMQGRCNTKASLIHNSKIWQQVKDMPTIDAIPVVRCAECAVPHNRWTGCPKLGGLIPYDDFYCGFGRKDGDKND